MEIKSKEISVIPIEQVRENPKNRNQHSQEQIERLAKTIQATGFRNPLIISNQTGTLVSGHGRLAALKMIGATTVPVIYQDFETPEDEYTFGIADNALNAWSELDFSGINLDLAEMGPFDLNLLGIQDFKLDVAETEKEAKPKQPKFCPHCQGEL